jgi:hypothetical protein
VRENREDSVASRDPDTIKQEIDRAREQLAATVDSLAKRADPRRIADDAKTRALAFVKTHAVTISVAGVGVLVVVVLVREIRNR